MKKYIAILALIFNVYTAPFQTLSQAEKRALQLTEFPPINNTNLMDADYTSYYQSITPNRFKKLLNSSITDLFQKILLQTIAARNQANLEGNIIGKLTCPKDSKLIIFSDVHAEFHSLIRSLKWLITQNMLSNDLVLPPNFFMFLNGDIINRGPYNIETLLLVFSLMEKNPHSFFYIRGNQETNSQWTNEGLKRELMIRFNSKKGTNIPLEKEMNQFFDSLPLAMYINTPEDPQNYLRISHYDRNNTDIKESLIIPFLATPTTTSLSYFNLNNPQLLKQNNQENINIIAIIKTEDWRRSFKGVNGLGMLDQDEGATAWGILSTPIEMNQKLLNFYYDAFAIVSIGNPLANSIISLYNRDIRLKHSFKKVSSFNIATAIPIQNEKDPLNNHSYYRIGSSMSLEQGVPIMGQRTNSGMNIKINKQNKAGGINNTFLQTTVLNDDYTPSIARQNITRFKNKDAIDVIMLPVGSPTLSAYLDYIRNKDIAVLFPITGAIKFRDPELKGIVHFRSSYPDEVNALIDYMVTTKAARKFALFFQDDDYGQGSLKAAHEALERNGIKDYIDVPYQRSTINFAQQAQKIKDYQPDAIGLFSTAQATQELLRQIGIDFLTNKQLFGISFLGEEPFRRFLKKTGLKVLFGAVVPNPKTSNLEIVKEYRQEMDAAKLPYDVFSLEAYITTSILIDALEKITPPITKDKILAQLESLHNYNFKGLSLSFNPKHRDLARHVWIETDENNEWEQKEINLNNSEEKDLNDQNPHISGPDQISKKPTNATP